MVDLTGWDKIDDIENPNNEISNEFDRLTYEVFTTIPGKQLLKLLTDQFLNGVVASPQDPASYAYWREGQNSLIRRFFNVIKKKEQQTPPITESIVTKSKSEEIKS